MKVLEVVATLSMIDQYEDKYNRGILKADDFEGLIGLIMEYREELLGKKVV